MDLRAREKHYEALTVRGGEAQLPGIDSALEMQDIAIACGHQGLQCLPGTYTGLAVQDQRDVPGDPSQRRPVLDATQRDQHGSGDAGDLEFNRFPNVDQDEVVLPGFPCGKPGGQLVDAISALFEAAIPAVSAIPQKVS